MKEAYTTQMDAARKKKFTPQMAQVIENESISRQDLLDRVAHL